MTAGPAGESHSSAVETFGARKCLAALSSRDLAVRNLAKSSDENVSHILACNLQDNYCDWCRFYSTRGQFNLERQCGQLGTHLSSHILLSKVFSIEEQAVMKEMSDILWIQQEWIYFKQQSGRGIYDIQCFQVEARETQDGHTTTYLRAASLLIE